MLTKVKGSVWDSVDNSHAVSIKDHGADQANTAAVNTAAIKAAIVAATPSSSTVFSAVDGGAVLIPAGIYEYDDELVIPEWVTLIGEGKGVSVLKSTTSTAKVSIGTQSAVDFRGGTCKDLTLDGDDVSINPLYIGKITEWGFIDIDIVNSIADGAILEGAQNCTFLHCGFQHNGTATGVGSGVVLDYGAGNNRFIGCEINRSGQNNVRIRQSGASGVGAFTVPTNNRFIGCMIERYRDDTTYDATIFQGNGRFNKFDKCDISLTGSTTLNIPLVKMRRTDTSLSSTGLLFDSCTFSGSAMYTAVFDGEGASGFNIDAQFMGYNIFENHSKVFHVNDYCNIIIGTMLDSSGGTFYTAKGSKGQNELVDFRLDDIILKLLNASAGDDVQYLTVNGESFPRWVWRPNGLSAGPGSGAVDVTLSRGSAAGVACWSVLAPLIMASGNINISMQSGSTAGWPAFPDGSLAIKTDGTAGTFLYGRIAGAWVALA